MGFMKSDCALMNHWLDLDELQFAARITASKAESRRKIADSAPEVALRQERMLQELDAHDAYLPLTDVFVVRAICAACRCVELEHVRIARPTESEPLLPSEQLPKFCPVMHEFKCPHIGHCDECVWGDECQSSDDEGSDV